jgi:two-component system cell cycle sensor histidine kinase/response regulator CckA
MNENPILVLADRNQLEQVLLKFAMNARDALPHDGVFSITTEEVNLDYDFISGDGFDKPGPYALITISDTGKGMDDKTRQRIFEPFFTTKEGTGTGLGLAVVYGIIKEHDGYIKVDRELGKVTTFSLYLSIIMQKTKEATEAHRLTAGTYFISTNSS